jgi:hypothetical protein
MAIFGFDDEARLSQGHTSSRRKHGTILRTSSFFARIGAKPDNPGNLRVTP